MPDISMSGPPLNGMATWVVHGERIQLPVRYKLSTALGFGVMGYTCSGMDSVTGREVTVRKVVKLFSDLTVARSVVRELHCLASLHHDNLTTLYDVIIPPGEFDSLVIVSNRMPISLQSLGRSSTPLSEDQIRYIAYQVLRALKFLHSAGVSHGAVAPSSILLSPSCAAILSNVATFAIRSHVDIPPASVALASAAHSLAAGAPPPLVPYSAPEILLRGPAAATAAAAAESYQALVAAAAAAAVSGGDGKDARGSKAVRARDRDRNVRDLAGGGGVRYGAGGQGEPAPRAAVRAACATVGSADMWSFGCLLAELLLGHALFPGASVGDVLRSVSDVLGTPSAEDMGVIASVHSRVFGSLPHKRPVPLRGPLGNANRAAVDLIEHLLLYNPAQRMSAEAALAHPYFGLLYDPSDEAALSATMEWPLAVAETSSTADELRAALRAISAKVQDQQRH